ncbi:MAG: TlpA disulfide reductase family protein [Gammaproteobacteria bacterium]
MWRALSRRTVIVFSMVVFTVASALVPAADMNEIRIESMHLPAPMVGLGKSSTLRDHRGHWVLLHFWATWCASCIKELPTLDQLSDRWRDKIEVFAISIDDSNDSAVDEFVARSKLMLPVIHRREANTTASYWNWGVPVTYLIDPNGRIVARVLGPCDWASNAADRMLTGLTLLPVPGQSR